MMRRLAVLALVACAPLGAAAQGVPAPSPAACVTGAEQPLGPLGRARTIAFEGALSHGTICALVVNVALDRIRSVVGAADPAAVATASLGAGNGAFLTANADGSPGFDTARSAGARPVGPLLLAPGGSFAAPGDVDQAPRLVLAIAANRLFLIATSAIDLADLTRSLRDRSSAFGADAPFERAVVLDSGAHAALFVRTLDGTAGTQPNGDVLSIAPR